MRYVGGSSPMLTQVIVKVLLNRCAPCWTVMHAE